MWDVAAVQAAHLGRYDADGGDVGGGGVVEVADVQCCFGVGATVQSRHGSRGVADKNGTDENEAGLQHLL